MRNRLFLASLGGIAAVLLSAGAAWAVAPVEVPEPASFGLLAAGIAGVAWLKFGRRRS